MKSCIHIILLFLIISLNLNTSFCQSISSPYSIFGAGLINNSATGKYTSMGGIGIALHSDESLNNRNPASYNGIDSLAFMFNIGMFGSYTKYNTQNTDKHKIDGNLSYFAIGFRINKWIASSLGIVPYSSVGYNINTYNSIDGIPELQYKTSTGEGGINKFYWGNSLQLSKYFSLGMNLTYIQGTIKKQEITEDNNYITGFISQSTQYINNLMMDYGALFTLGIKNSSVSIGAIYNNNKSLHTSSDFYYTSEFDTLELPAEKSTYFIPEKLGLGISFDYNDLFTIGFDYEKRFWSPLKLKESSYKLRDSEKYSFGLEFKPEISKRTFNLRNLEYRVGGYYEKSYLIIHNIQLDRKALTFGVGIPVNRRLSRINLGFEIGQYGTLSKGLIKENYGIMHLDISLRDIWFQKRKYD